MAAEAEKPSTFSPTFLKITRTGGPLMRRLANKSKGGVFFDKLRPIPTQIPIIPIQKALNAISKRFIEL